MSERAKRSPAGAAFIAARAGNENKSAAVLFCRQLMAVEQAS